MQAQQQQEHQHHRKPDIPKRWFGDKALHGQPIERIEGCLQSRCWQKAAIDEVFGGRKR
jgi:hypothetical protein